MILIRLKGWFIMGINISISNTKVNEDAHILGGRILQGTVVLMLKLKILK